MEDERHTPQRMDATMTDPEQNPTPLPYTRERLIANLDRLIGEAASLTAEWMNRDREDAAQEKAIAGRLLNVHRAMSADMHEIGQIDYREEVRQPLQRRRLYGHAPLAKSAGGSFDTVIARMNGGR